MDKFLLFKVFSNFNLILCVCGCFVCMHTCVPYVYSGLRGQKMVSDALELELQTGVSSRVSAGNQTQAFYRRGGVTNH